MMKSPYPIILDLANKKIAVIGGGHVATRKIKKLVDAGVKPTVISPELSDGIDAEKVNWIKDIYRRKYVEDMNLIITCTDKPEVNDQVKAEAAPLQLVNNTGDKNNSDFYNLASVRANGVLISVSTLGQSPSTAKKVKGELAAWFSRNN